MSVGRPDYREALADSSILAVLRDFDPHVAGTPPLGLDGPDSDLDVLCFAPHPDAIAQVVWQGFGTAVGFAMWQRCAADRAVVASFRAHGWRFEIFAQDRPVSQQHGWRHFEIERRLLDLGAAALREKVLAQRRAGLKTEPAFAAVLGLSGDPYEALLELEAESDGQLLARLGMT